MAKTTIPSELIADNAVGITQLNVSDGSNGQFLKTDGSGTLSFGTVSTTTALDDIATGDAASTLATSSGNITIDSPAAIILDADGADIMFKDGGTEFGRVYNSSSDLAIYSAVQDKDIKLQGNDGGSVITALTLDMSDAGYATFNSGIAVGNGINVNGGNVSFVDNSKIKLGTGDDLQIYHNGSNSYITDAGTGELLIQSNTVAIQNAAGSENMAKFIQDGAVQLYYNDGIKLVTSATGVSITGNVNPSGTYGTSGTHLEMVYPAATNAEFKIFRSNGNTAMRLTEQENLLLGFGTSSQVSTETKLQVAANSASGGVVGFYDSDVSCSIGNIILRLAFTHDDDCTNSSFIHFADSGGTIGSVYAGNANSVVFSTVSDERLKENIVDASSQLNTVKNIKVREFDWKKDGTHQVGFIAQELNSIVPEAVSEGSDDVTEHPWGVDYGKLTPYLVKAIQEQQTTIEALTARIATLEG